MRILRSIDTERRDGLSSQERWRGKDKGLIACWESGRDLAALDADLAAEARAGRLVVLPWKGGVAKRIKGSKVGTLWYLAMWQGLRGEDLDIDLDDEPILTCAVTNVSVTYTLDYDSYKNAR